MTISALVEYRILKVRVVVVAMGDFELKVTVKL